VTDFFVFFCQAFVQLFILGWMGDNPMLEKLSMLTGKGFCRICSVRDYLRTGLMDLLKITS
jgi:hypothetical protein